MNMSPLPIPVVKVQTSTLVDFDGIQSNHLKFLKSLGFDINDTEIIHIVKHFAWYESLIKQIGIQVLSYHNGSDIDRTQPVFINDVFDIKNISIINNKDNDEYKGHFVTSVLSKVNLSKSTWGYIFKSVNIQQKHIVIKSVNSNTEIDFNNDITNPLGNNSYSGDTFYIRNLIDDQYLNNTTLLFSESRIIWIPSNLIKNINMHTFTSITCDLSNIDMKKPIGICANLLQNFMHTRLRDFSYFKSVTYI